MFENTITENGFTGPIADQMFEHSINGSGFYDDMSFLTTLRCLLYSRIKNRSITLEYVTAKSPEDFPESFLNNHLYVINYSYHFGDSEEAKNAFNQIFVGDNFHEFKDVQKFFERKMLCRAFIDEINKISIIMVNNLNNRMNHLIQCIIPKMLPWFFTDVRLSVLEKNLLYSLQKKLSGPYEDAVRQFCERRDFIEKRTACALKLFHRRSLTKKKDRVENKIGECNSQIEEYFENISSINNRLMDLNFELSGIENAMNSDIDESDELLEMLSNNRNVEIVRCEDTIDFKVRGFLDVFDPDNYESLSSNRNSWYWSGRYLECSNEVFDERQNRKKVLDSIFSNDPKFKLKTCSIYTIDSDNCYASTKSHYSFGSGYRDCYPNPHHYYASCLGSYRRHITNCLRNGDLTGAIAQCITATHSVNVTESATFGHLVDDIFNSNEKLLVGPDGNSYSTLEAYNYLVEEEKKVADQETTQE